MDKWKKLHNLCKKMYEVSEWPDELSHAEKTLEWLLKINPNASEELKVSAYAHDIERTFITKREQKDYETYINHKKEHSKRSADIVCTMMFTLEFSPTAIQRVHYLICNHEVGGDSDANDLKDADSLSYFENNLSGYYEKRGLEGTRTKIDFMYSRMSEHNKPLVNTITYSSELKELIDSVIG